MSALGAMLPVQIVTKNSLQASLQIVFTTNLATLRVKSTQRHKHKKQLYSLYYMHVYIIHVCAREKLSFVFSTDAITLRKKPK